MAVTNASNQPINHASNSTAVKLLEIYPSAVPVCCCHISSLVCSVFPLTTRESCQHMHHKPLSSHWPRPHPRLLSTPTRLTSAPPPHRPPCPPRAGSPSTAARVGRANRSRWWRLPSRRWRNRSSGSTGTPDAHKDRETHVTHHPNPLCHARSRNRPASCFSYWLLMPNSSHWFAFRPVGQTARPFTLARIPSREPF